MATKGKTKDKANVVTSYSRLTDDQRRRYNAQNNQMKRERLAREKRMLEEETMLMKFMRAKTPKDKRDVIKSFCPHFFIFGNTLDPRNPYENNEGETA